MTNEVAYYLASYLVDNEHNITNFMEDTQTFELNVDLVTNVILKFFEELP